MTTPRTPLPLSAPPRPDEERFQPYYADDLVTLLHGDCLDAMRSLPDASVDAVVTDPPYGLGLMGKAWDVLPPGLEWAEACLRVLKPGGYILAFGGTRTWHRLAVAIEDAGFELRDSIAWLYGSGFPKSRDVSKAIDKAAGADRAVVAERTYADGAPGRSRSGTDLGVLNDDGWLPTPRRFDTAPATDAAREWQGWGTALKPAFEPIVVARKPLVGTVAANVLQHGTGALNIDACRIATSPEDATAMARCNTPGSGRFQPERDERAGHAFGRSSPSAPLDTTQGRWPANVVLDESQAEGLDRQTGVTTSRVGKPRGADAGEGWGMTATGSEYADAGGASRFFPTFRYEAKAPTIERPRNGEVIHPTVKPLDLMRWLVRLVTPRGGVVLDPFLGSGTTAEACVLEHLRCIGIEREADYLPLTIARLSKPLQAGFDFEVTA